MEKKIKSIYDIQDDKLKLAIFDTLDNFDFEKVQKYMEYANWTWVGDEIDEDGRLLREIPSIQKIKATAKQLILDTINNCLSEDENDFNGPYSVSTGGLKVIFNKGSENNTYSLSLEFIIEEFTCDFY